MKKLSALFAALSILIGLSTASAQGLKLPQASSGQTIIQDFGIGKITVNYSRPNAKGRKIFGGLVPYNAVWRTGANSATTIQFTDDVELEGHKLAAGEYGLFTVPGKDEWTIVINKTAKQWGAYNYNAEDDVLRFKVKPTETREQTETFTIQFMNVLPASCDLQLAWEHTAVKIHLTTDVDSKVMASIDEAMKGDKKPYSAAAQYYYDNNKDQKKALEWITEAEKTNEKSPSIKLWKARILLKLGDKKAALATAQEGAKLAREQKNEEYTRLNEELAAQAR
jgi:hypothetical protein